MITAAAIKTLDGKVWVVPRPARHDSVFFAIAESIGYDIKADRGKEDSSERDRWLAYVRGHISGFVTEAGEFLDRVQALWHVDAVGQPLLAGRIDSATRRQVAPDEIIGGVLTSEDLW